MGNKEIEETTREILGNTKSSTAKALVIMAKSIDNMTEAIKDNQRSMDSKLCAYQESTDKRFKKLASFTFLSEYWPITVMLLVAIIIIMIWSVQSGDPVGASKILK